MAARTKEPAATLTAAQVRDALLQRYQSPEWHTETEFTLEGRRLDVFAMNRWGARSYRTVGFEIKVSRGDWRRELEDFRKSDLWTHVVDQFFVVAPGGIVDLEELPHGWGLLELRGVRMFTKRQALIGTSTTLPRELAARMVDRLCKRVSDLQWRADSESRALTAGERMELRREIEEQLRNEAAKSESTLQRDAYAYRKLMHDVGLGVWNDPAKILQTALQVSQLTERWRENESLRWGVESFVRNANQATKSATDLLDGIAALRALLGATPGPEELQTQRLPHGGRVIPTTETL